MACWTYTMSSLESRVCALWLHLHSRQSWWYIQTCNKLLTPPPLRGRRGRLVSDWWALLSFIFDNQRWPASSTIHLPCHWQTRRVKLRKGKVWSSLQTAISARYILCLRTPHVKYDWQQVLMCVKLFSKWNLLPLDEYEYDQPSSNANNAWHFWVTGCLHNMHAAWGDDQSVIRVTRRRFNEASCPHMSKFKSHKSHRIQSETFWGLRRGVVVKVETLSCK